MKKNNLVKAAAFIFAASMAFGVGTALEASANETSPFDSLALVDGASVRYGAEDGKNGIRFTLTIDKADYDRMEEAGYTNVQFGVLVAPERYHDIYAMNEENVFGANAKYCWDGEQAGKAEIFNLNGALVQDALDESKMTFYGAVVDILDGDPVGEDNNVALDFRAVGYAQYTFNGETQYKLVGDEDNVRSMAYVAQEVKALPGVDEEMANFLQTAYLDKVDWELKAENLGTTEVEPTQTAPITIPTTVKALDNTFYADKYDVVWTFAGTEVEAGASIAMPKLTGVYKVVGTAVNKTNPDDKQVVYTKSYNLLTPTLNENALNAFGSFTYNPTTGVYDSRVSGVRQFFVDSVTDGDFVATNTITTTFKEGTGINMPGMIIGTSGYDNYITLKGLGGSGRMYLTVRTSNADGVYTSTECYISGNLSGADKVNGITKYTVARVNNTYYIYSYDGSFCCAVDSTGIYPASDKTVSFEGSQTMAAMQANLAVFFAKGTKNIVGIYSNAYNANANIGYSHDFDYTLGTEAAAKYAIGTAKVNGLDMVGTGTATYAGNGTWQNADAQVETRQYYLNTIVKGDTDFVLEANTEVVSKTGFGGWTGVSLGMAKTTRSDKTIADKQMRIDFKTNNADQALYGKVLTIYARRSDGYNMTITVKGFNANVGGSGAQSKMTLVRLGDALYVYDTTDTLVCTLDKTGVHGATAANTVTYSGQTQDWYASQIAYSFFTGAPEVVAGLYNHRYSADHYGVFKTALTMTRGTAAANNKVNPSA